MENTACITARRNMVDGQLRPNRINHPVLLGRLKELARTPFVPAENRAMTYLDQPVPIGQGRHLFSPLVTAHLVQALEVKRQDTVLVLGGGTGYAAAILSGLAGHVIMVEDNAELFAYATAQLKQYPNISLLHERLETFNPKRTVEGILVDTPYAVLPNLKILTQALAPGGHLTGVRNPPNSPAEVVVHTRYGNALLEEVLFETKTLPAHPAYAAEQNFTF